ncbi:MAG: CPBP family glutamic-type intramembrane protease [Alphaproteobacteria bacterium]|nr:CPBP family glutamic-type intramembrane protease [Alphaproteobacteria bacterium]
MTPPPGPAAPRLITIRSFIGITLMTVLIFVVGGIVLVKLDPTIFAPERAVLDKLLWAALLANVGVLASTGYVLGTRTVQGWGLIRLEPPSPRWVLIALATAAALFFAGERLDALFEFGVLDSARTNYGPSLKTQIGLIGLFVVLGVVVPIPLEIYFRGVLFNFLRGLITEEAAIGLSSILYGLLFFNPAAPINIAYGIAHGAVLCLLYVRSGTLWTAIVANGALGALTVAKLAWG